MAPEPRVSLPTVCALPLFQRVSLVGSFHLIAGSASRTPPLPKWNSDNASRRRSQYLEMHNALLEAVDIRSGHSATHAHGPRYLRTRCCCRFRRVRIDPADAGTDADTNSENNRNDLSSRPETGTACNYHDFLCERNAGKTVAQVCGFIL